MPPRNLPMSRLLVLALGVLGVILAGPACREEPPEDVVTSPQEAEPPRPILVPADAQDASDAPHALPASGEVPAWVKTEPIRVAVGGEMGRFLPDMAMVEVARTFEGIRLARTTYERQVSPQQDPSLTCRADVWYFEAGDPLDAFGLFSLMSRRRGLTIRWQDGSAREIRSEQGRRVLLAWQGNACVRIVSEDCPSEDEEADPLVHLLDRIIFYLPAAEPPVLLRALPAEGRRESKVWVVRDPNALRWADDVRVRDLPPAELTARLGLTGEPVLMIASVPIGARQEAAPDAEPVTRLEAAPDAEPATRSGEPLLIWVVDYPHEQQAWEAYERYEVVVAEGRSARDRATHVLEPVGPFLAGTWSADQENSLAALGELRELLPFAVQTHPALMPATAPAEPATAPAEPATAPADCAAISFDGNAFL